jgi:hypothetical protein
VLGTPQFGLFWRATTRTWFFCSAITRGGSVPILILSKTYRRLDIAAFRLIITSSNATNSQTCEEKIIVSRPFKLKGCVCQEVNCDESVEEIIKFERGVDVLVFTKIDFLEKQDQW